MTQRNKFHTPDISQRTNTITAGAVNGVLMSVPEVAAAPVPAPPSRSRRGTKIAASLPIEVRDQFGTREETRTQFLMIRGAVLASSANVRVGHKLTIQNLKSGRIAECHVIAVEPVLRNVHQIEVEFTRPQPDFWPVQFPAEEARNEAAFTGTTTAYAERSSIAPEHEPGSMLEIEKNPSPEIPSEVRTLPSHQIVSLADPIAQNFNSSSTQRYSAQTATLDSVAQFRAANRAAHRRQQQMKAFYTVVTIAVLAAGFVWFRSGNHPQIDAQMEKIHVSTPAAAQPAPVTAVTPAIQTVVRKPQAAVNAAAPVAPAPVAAEPTQAAAAPAQAADADVDSEAQPTQVVVRHGAISETLRKPRQADEEEQPLALPLKSAAAAGAPKPELLSSVVAPIPGKNPVLAVSAPKKFVPARLLRSVSAQYPPVARQMHAEGTVILDVEIDAAGNVASAKASSGPPLLRAAAVDAVQRWKYVPATLGDKPVASGQQVKVDFRLH